MNNTDHSPAADKEIKRSTRKKNIFYLFMSLLEYAALSPLFFYLDSTHHIPFSFTEVSAWFAGITIFCFAFGLFISFLLRALNLKRDIRLYRICIYGMITAAAVLLGMMAQRLE